MVTDIAATCSGTVCATIVTDHDFEQMERNDGHSKCLLCLLISIVYAMFTA